MQHLAAIGAEWDMAKMMLTVFKGMCLVLVSFRAYQGVLIANSLAFKFYETFGYNTPFYEWSCAETVLVQVSQ